MEIKQEAVKRAIRLLNAVEAQYHIFFDGVEHGAALELDRKRKRSELPMGTFSAIYKEALNGIEVNEVRVINIPSEMPIKNFMSSLSAYIIKAYGSKSCIYTRDGNHIEVMRIE